MKKTIILLLMTAIVFLFVLTVSAHSSSQKGIIESNQIYDSDNKITDDYGSKYYVGGEDIGWSIDEDLHTNGKKITYKINTEWVVAQNLYKEAMKLWGSYVTFEEDNVNGAGRLETDWMPNKENIIASVYHYDGEDYVDANGHYKSWGIIINTIYLYTATPANIAHEFGHVLGLNDLYKTSNTDKLMCWSASKCTATRPTVSDIRGWRVISGDHSEHVWVDLGSTKQCSVCDGIQHTHSCSTWVDYSATLHKGVCYKCSQTVYASHTWNAAKGKCVTCGRSTAVEVPLE